MEMPLPQITKLSTYRCLLFATTFCATGKCPHLPKCYTDPTWPDDVACFIKGKKPCPEYHHCICTQPIPPSPELQKAYFAWKEKYTIDNPEYDESAELYGSYKDSML